VKAVAARRECVRHLQQCGLSERCALKLLDMSVSVLRYQARGDSNAELRERLKELAGQHRRHGYRMLHSRLRNDGWAINVKRTYRVYREEGLMVRKRRRKKLPVPERQPLLRPEQPNEVWSMDFLFDELASGRRVKALTVVDDCSKEAVQIVADTSIPALYVTRVLDQVKTERGLPKVIRTDNGPEFAGRTMQDWAARNGVELRFIQPGSPSKTPTSRASTQQPLPGRMPLAALVRQPEPHAQRHRQLARRLQPPSRPQQPGLRATGALRGPMPPARRRHWGDGKQEVSSYDSTHGL
jgi:putative transposase